MTDYLTADFDAAPQAGRRFAIDCIERVIGLTTNARVITCFDVAKRHAAGKGTDADLDEAHSTAWDEAKDADLAGDGPERKVAWAVAWVTAHAYSGASNAAYEAAEAAAIAAGRQADNWSRFRVVWAARDAERAWQTARLQEAYADAIAAEAQ